MARAKARTPRKRNTRAAAPETKVGKSAPDDWLDLLFENTLDGIVLTDISNRHFANANPAFCRMLGCTLEEVRRLSVNDIHPPGMLEHVIPKFEQGVTGERRLAKDVPVLRKDGSVFYADVDGTVVTFGGRPHLLGIFRDVSDRRRSEESLRMSESTFAQLYENLRDAFVSTAMDGRILEFNSAYRDMLGYTGEELLTRTYLDITPACWHEIEGRIVREQIIPRGYSDVYEKEYRRKDGTVFPVELRVFLVRDESGRPESMWGIVRDITERRRVREALKASEDRYRAATELLSDYVFRLRVEPDGRAVMDSLSNNFERITGRRTAEVTEPGDWLNTIHPEDRPQVAQALQKLIREGGEDHREFRSYVLRLGKQVLRWVEVYSKAERDPATGRVTSIIGAVRNVSDRKAAEFQQNMAVEALRESEMRFRKIVEQSPMSMAIVGLDGTIEFINQKAIETFGYRTDDIPTMERWWVQAYPDEAYRREVIATWTGHVERAIAENREIQGGEYRVTCKDGMVKTVFVFGVPVANKVLVMFEDITERKLAEEALRHRTEELVALNTLSLTVSASLSLEEVTSVALREMLHAARTDLAFLFTREGERLILRGVEPEAGRERLGQVPAHRVGECMCGLAVAQGHPIYSRDIFSDKRCTWAECKKAGFRSFAALPLRNGSDVIGVIGLPSLTERDFEGQGRFLETLASAVSVSLQNAQLFAQTRRAIQAIEEERQFSDSIVEGLPGVFYLFDEQGRFLRWNRNFERISDYSAEEIAGLHPLAFFRGADKDRVAQRIGTVFSKGSAEVEAEFVSKNGERTPYFLTGLRVVLDGKPCLIGLGMDITERKLAEDALRASEEHYRQIFDINPDAMFLIGSDGRFLDANRAAVDRYGYSVDEFRRMGPPDLAVGAEFQAKAPQKVAEAMQGPAHWEWRHRSKQGREFWVDVQTMPTEIRGARCVFANVRDITERKRAEEALRESEAQYRALIETTDTGYVILDRKGYVVDANLYYARLAGRRTTAEVLGCSVLEWSRPQDVDKNAEAVRVCLEQGFIRNLEVSYVDAEGKVTPIEINATVVGSGDSLRILSLCRDITDRKRAEATLEQNERLLRAISENLADGMVYQIDSGVDGQKRILSYLSPAVERMHGLKMEEVLRDPALLYSQVIDEDRALLAAREERAFAQRTAMDIDVRVRLASGEVRWRHFRSTPRTIPNGSVVWDGIEFDITERRRAEEAIREREERYRATLASMTDLVFVLDRDGRFIDYHVPGGVGLYREAGDFLGKPFKEVLPPSVSEQLARAIEAIRAGAPVQRMDYTMEIGGKSTSWNASVSPRWDAKEVYDGATVVARSMTDQRLLEERLHQAEKLTAIGQLAGGIAHDFNNQLAGVMGYADLLNLRLEEGPLKRYAQGIAVSARRAADLTQQLLAYGRKGKFLSVPVDIHHLLGEVVDILERSIDKRIRISQVLRASHPVVMGDPTQVENALLNLALNARDAMAQGGELTFETDTVALDEEYCRANPLGIAAGQYLRVCVIDTGCGMAEDVKRHLFEPFFTTKKVGEGTGMGLASVYGTVRNHHGSIQVQSEVGRGTVVRIDLPLAALDVKLEESGAPALPARGTANILLVDDERTVREMATDLLRDLGYNVAVCSDGLEAVDYYRENWRKVDLVVLDMVMPRMGGHDTFVAMRRINPRIRTLLSSGYSLNGDAQAILDEGVMGFVGKPYQRAELSRSILDALGKGG